jgi:hypothetical protein
MKVLIITLSALVIVGGLAFPVGARDVTEKVTGWEAMSKEDKDKTLKNITRKHHLKPEDRIKIQSTPTEIPGFEKMWCPFCVLSGQSCPC